MVLFSADSPLVVMIKMVRSWLKFKSELPSSFIAVIPKTFRRPIGVKVNFMNVQMHKMNDAHNIEHLMIHGENNGTFDV